jgi:hypothetical protein
VAAPDSQTLEAKNKAFEERYGSEYESQGGNRADFNTRLALVTQNLHEPFGMSYITVNNVEAICRIAYASLFREMTDSEILKLPVYARTHSFWKKRTPTYSALANNMANGDETGLIAQFRSAQALLGKVSHKPLSNVEVAAIKGVGFTKEEVEYERTHDGNGNLIAVGTGFDVEEAE